MTPATKPKRTPLSRDQIAKAALAYLDRHGLESLSMRRLAHELGVGTMTLYHYFQTKQDLLDALSDQVVADVGMPELSGDWREQLRTLARAGRAMLTAHPSLVQIRVQQPVLRPEALHFGEAGLRILEDAGLPPDEAARSFRLVFTYTFGFAAFSPAAAERQAREAAHAALSHLPPEYFPRLSQAVEEAAEAMAGDAVFEYGLERILDGFEARIGALRSGG